LIPKQLLLTEAFVNSPPYYLVRSGTTRGNSKPYRNNLGKDKVRFDLSSVFSVLKPLQ